MRTFELPELRSALLGVVVAGTIVPAIAGLTACGGGDAHESVVARVGAVSIGRTAVDHWTRVIELGGALGGRLEQSHGTARQRALDFLISTDWLIGEAAVRGFTVPYRAIERSLEERVESTPQGVEEFKERLKSNGETVADAKLEVEVGLAAAAIRQMLRRQSAKVTAREVTDYYKSNQRRFLTPEGRVVELVENLTSRSAASALGHRIGPGPRFARMAFHESLERPSGFEPGTEKGALVRAIFKAGTDTVSAPVRLDHHWTIFVVRSTTPARLKPLRKVRATIVGRLNTQHLQATVARYFEEYRRRWTSRTSCRSGYIVEQCAQYEGPRRPEEDPF